jgi:hypothetical protein
MKNSLARNEDRIDAHLGMTVGEINALLQEAYDSIAQGKYAPLEPIDQFLRRMHERWRSKE